MGRLKLQHEVLWKQQHYSGASPSPNKKKLSGGRDSFLSNDDEIVNKVAQLAKKKSVVSEGGSQMMAGSGESISAALEKSQSPKKKVSKEKKMRNREARNTLPGI